MKSTNSIKRVKLSSSRAPKRRYTPPPPTRRRTRVCVSPDQVELRSGTGTPKHGGMAGGSFWHVYHEGVRAGRVYVNYDKETERASIQIFMNRKSQGKGIGRVAYRMACEESGHRQVYASMRQSNVASIHAARAAGFKEIQEPTGQVTMLWEKE